jgi:hypothetical protein
MIDVCDIEVVALGSRFWTEPSSMDTLVDVPHRNTTTFDMRFVVNPPNDTRRPLRHLFERQNRMYLNPVGTEKDAHSACDPDRGAADTPFGATGHPAFMDDNGVRRPSTTRQPDAVLGSRTVFRASSENIEMSQTTTAELQDRAETITSHLDAIETATDDDQAVGGGVTRQAIEERLDELVVIDSR